MPNLLTLDIELAKLIARGTDPAKSPISVMSAWGVRDIELAPYVWLLDGGRLPRVLIAEAHAEGIFQRYDGIVTWNGVNFDAEVIKKRHPKIGKTFARATHVDLHAICCLLQAGVEVERIAAGLEKGWTRMAPTLREDLVSTGWGLDAVAAGTLGVGKLEGPKGLEAVKAWEDGRYSEVTSYNIADTALTRALYRFAWTHGYLVSRERGRVDIPREVLG
jgi:DNA polymerase elongation subunit (family B)